MYSRYNNFFNWNTVLMRFLYFVVFNYHYFGVDFITADNRHCFNTLKSYYCIYERCDCNKKKNNNTNHA